MTDLADVYAHVQARKEEPVDLPSEAVDALSKSFRMQFGRAPSSAELSVSVRGFGWIHKMTDEQGLDMRELVQIAEELAKATSENMEAAQAELQAEDVLSAGVGGGFFTGLWVGLLLKEGL